jgi:hypothetical protein
MKNFGFREVRIRFLGGFEITLLARYYARSQARVEKGKGAYFGLLLLGIYDRCSPALASEVAKQGRIEREFTPVLDGTLKGPDAVFRLIEFYSSELGIEAATKVLFIADGARWIWNRVAALGKRLGLKAEQCFELVDF